MLSYGDRYHSPILLNMEVYILIYGFIKRAGIESHLRVPIGNESTGCDLGEFKSQYPFVNFLMKGFGQLASIFSMC